MQDTPLQGIKVLDLTQIYQGPYASFLMAMAGADVVKVESHACLLYTSDAADE